MPPSRCAAMPRHTARPSGARPGRPRRRRPRPRRRPRRRRHRRRAASAPVGAVVGRGARSFRADGSGHGGPRRAGLPARPRVGSGRVTGLDWLIVAFTVVMATVGWRQGFIAGVLALAGFVAGAFVGSRLAPAVLSGGSSSPYAPLFALIGAMLGGA